VADSLHGLKLRLWVIDRVNWRNDSLPMCAVIWPLAGYEQSHQLFSLFRRHLTSKLDSSLPRSRLECVQEAFRKFPVDTAFVFVNMIGHPLDVCQRGR
jgi:hypothetical protein